MHLDIFSSIFSSEAVNDIDIGGFLLVILFSLATGLVLAFSYTFKNTYTKSFVITLAMLPAVVSVVIIMVNGNVGTGVAVAGVFSLVRFRSVPGTAKEIGAIFIAMSSGLVIGMGYLAYGFIFALILSGLTMFYNNSKLGEKKDFSKKTITITIPEDLNYTNVFTDLMQKYTKKNNLTFVKTTNMGSLFKLTYDIELKDCSMEKDFIDEIRCRNGNLEIAISPTQTNVNEL
ncbi:MAG: DUF4956 domain-containing protein [Clostridia bacterium]